MTRGRTMNAGKKTTWQVAAVSAAALFAGVTQAHDRGHGHGYAYDRDVGHWRGESRGWSPPHREYYAYRPHARWHDWRHSARGYYPHRHWGSDVYYRPAFGYPAYGGRVIVEVPLY